jgi:hypothetical protein
VVRPTTPRDSALFPSFRETAIEWLTRAQGVGIQQSRWSALLRLVCQQCDQLPQGGAANAGLISRLLKRTLLHFILNTVHKFTFQCTDNALGWTPRTHGRNNARASGICCRFDQTWSYAKSLKALSETR